MAPAPTFHHQETSRDILIVLSHAVKASGLGSCVSAPVDVYLDDNNVFQPDIIFIAKQNLSIIKNGRVKGVPGLVVEILTPGTRKQDTVTKKAVYERAGVKEYFIVDPVNRQVTAFFLRQKKFVKQAPAKGKLVSKLLGGRFEF